LGGEELTYEKIRDLALKLYFAKAPRWATLPSDEDLKIKGYWTKARLILMGKRETPKYISKAFYSSLAHLERLKELLEWAKMDDELQKCLKHDALTKVQRLIKEESKEKYGVGPKLASEYAKIILARLKAKEKIYTKWGFL
jgi:hypothetical protein